MGVIAIIYVMEASHCANCIVLGTSTSFADCIGTSLTAIYGLVTGFKGLCRDAGIPKQSFFCFFGAKPTFWGILRVSHPISLFLSCVSEETDTLYYKERFQRKKHEDPIYSVKGRFSKNCRHCKRKRGGGGGRKILWVLCWE